MPKARTTKHTENQGNRPTLSSTNLHFSCLVNFRTLRCWVPGLIGPCGDPSPSRSAPASGAAGGYAACTQPGLVAGRPAVAQPPATPPQEPEPLPAPVP